MTYISVIIPTHNRAISLRNTLSSLRKQTLPQEKYEVIVVDNASSDETRKIVEDINTKSRHEVKYVFEKQIGLHFARHRGAKEAKGEILVYLDDDVICEKNWLSEIVKPYNENLDIGCVGGRIFPKWETGPPKWIKCCPPWYLGLLDLGEELKAVQWVNGNNFSIRKSILFEVGGFNPDAFSDKDLRWYRGDGEAGLLRKVHYLGKRVIYAPKALGWHVIPERKVTLQYLKERALKHAIERSFVEYRDNSKLTWLKLPLFSIIYLAGFAMYQIFSEIFHLWSNINYYTCKIRASYCRGRFLHNLKLATSGNLRHFVQTEKWLE